MQIVTGFTRFEFSEFFTCFRNPKLCEIVEFFRSSENSWNNWRSKSFGKVEFFYQVFSQIKIFKMKKTHIKSLSFKTVFLNLLYSDFNLPSWSIKIFSRAGNKFATSKAQRIRDNHYESHSQIVSSSFPARLKIQPLDSILTNFFLGKTKTFSVFCC